MRYWLDTEFIDRRPAVHLVSIGIVAEDGREYYAELFDAPLSLACPWFKENVMPHLTGKTTPAEQVRDELFEFLGPDPEFWLWYGAYDWVAFTQLWGRMVDAPTWALDDYYNDLRQFTRDCEVRTEFPPKPPNAHNALADARWTRELWRAAVDARMTMI